MADTFLDNESRLGALRLGALPEEHKDPRNYEWNKLGMGTKLTPNDHSKVPKFRILDQGASNACGGFAAAAYKYAIEYRQIGNVRCFSPYWTYGNRVSGARWCEGMYTSDICRGVQQNGIPFYQPYDDGAYTWKEARDIVKPHIAELKPEALKFKNNSYYYCHSWTEIMQAIKTTGGCLIMIPIYYNMYGADEYIDKYTDGFTGGYHFVCGVDYTDDFKYVKCVNSWGDYNDGHGYVWLNTKLGFEEAVAFVDNSIEEELKAFEFSDVATDRWSRDNIQLCAANHIMEGFEDHTFHPEEALTRAQAAKVFCSLLNLKPVRPTESTRKFKDMMNSPHWAMEFILAVVNAGIMQGFDDGSFSPDGPLTREQMAIMITKAYNLPKIHYVPFEDVNPNRWSCDYISAVAYDGIMVGVGENKFEPAASITREQMAAIACRLLGIDVR